MSVVSGSECVCVYFVCLSMRAHVHKCVGGALAMRSCATGATMWASPTTVMVVIARLGVPRSASSSRSVGWLVVGR